MDDSADISLHGADTRKDLEWVVISLPPALGTIPAAEPL